jgi:hypothetical protein
MKPTRRVHRGHLRCPSFLQRPRHGHGSGTSPESWHTTHFALASSRSYARGPSPFRSEQQFTRQGVGTPLGGDAQSIIWHAGLATPAVTPVAVNIMHRTKVMHRTSGRGRLPGKTPLPPLALHSNAPRITIGRHLTTDSHGYNSWSLAATSRRRRLPAGPPTSAQGRPAQSSAPVRGRLSIVIHPH